MKSKNDIKEYVDSLNKQFDKRLSIVKKYNNQKDNLLLYLLSCDDRIIFDTLGEAGLKLKNILKTFDLNHEQISSSYNQFFSFDKLHCQKVREIFEFKKTANKDSSSLINDIINRSFLHEEDLMAFVKKIYLFVSEKPPVRFLVDPEKRDLLRRTKKPQLINLNYIYKKGVAYLDSLPKDFNDYLRYDLSQINDTNILIKKIDRFKEIGCNFLAEDLQKTMDEHVEQYGRQYFGFNRINLTTCALVLAKLYELEISLNKYQLSSGLFEDTWNCQHMFFDYKPKIYPYYEFESLASSRIKSVIDYLDHMPEVDGKPIFDYFSVVVPTCDIEQEIEFELIKNGILKSVLIGEKDGWCYFICFFN